VIAQLSDFHVRDDDDSLPALEAAVEAVLALRPLPDAVLVSGDLADHGREAEYAAVRERLAALPMPVHAIPGNHDDRETMTAAFGPTLRSARCGRLRLVGCDTLVPGSDAGRLGEEQLAWLDDQLAADTETPTLVAMHHPPILTGIAAADDCGLPADDRAGLAAILERHPQVRRAVTGHVHRAASGSIGGCPVSVCPGVNLQGVLDLRPEGDFALVAEPPAIAIHLLAGGEVVTHLQPTGYRVTRAPAA
jgi:3',5'-cyclic-AMP phosphodiesterase